MNTDFQGKGKGQKEMEELSVKNRINFLAITSLIAITIPDRKKYGGKPPAQEQTATAKGVII